MDVAGACVPPSVLCRLVRIAPTANTVPSDLSTGAIVLAQVLSAAETTEREPLLQPARKAGETMRAIAKRIAVEGVVLGLFSRRGCVVVRRSQATAGASVASADGIARKAGWRNAASREELLPPGGDRRSLGTTPSDLICYGIEGRLEISVMVIRLHIEIGTIEGDKDDYYTIPEAYEFVDGTLPTREFDLWQLTREGSINLTCFKSYVPDGYISTRYGDPLPITPRDLLITREERDRFEQAHGLDPDGPPAGSGAAPGALGRLPEPRFVHSSSYANVMLDGQAFRLGPLQASIVRQLHEASLAGGPWRNGKALLAASSARTLRMVDLFKSKPTWRQLIDSDSRGRYRLNLSERVAGPRPGSSPQHGSPADDGVRRSPPD